MNDFTYLKLNIKPFKFGLLKTTGKEVARDLDSYRNLVEVERSYLNVPLKEIDKPLDVKFNEIVNTREYKLSNKACPVCHFIYSATLDFFVENGYVRGRKPPKIIEEFFLDGYNFLLKKFGRDNNENILAAYIHYDETVPHLQAYFIPIENKYYVQHKKNSKNISGNIVNSSSKYEYAYMDLDYYYVSLLNVYKSFGNGNDIVGHDKVYLDLKNELGSKYLLKVGLKGREPKLTPLESRYQFTQEKIKTMKEINKMEKEILFEKINELIKLKKEKESLEKEIEKLEANNKTREKIHT